MEEPAGSAVLRRLVERMRADEGLLDGAVEAARAISAPVAALPVQEVQRHILALLGAIGTVFGDPAGPDSPAIDEFGRAADRLASDRALQGVPLAALLEGYQAARLYVVHWLIDNAQSAEVPMRDLIDGLLELDTFTNYLQNRLVHAYRETELSLARTAHAARTQALRDLLHDGPPNRIAEAGLDPAKAYHCWIADVTDTSQMRPIEAALNGQDGVSGLVEGYLCGVTSRLPGTARLDHTLVVAGPAVPATELAGSYRLCAAALASARSFGLRGLRSLTWLALAVAADAHPQLGDMLADEHLARLDVADEFHRLLAETALVYLAHGSRADLAAVALHVHPNTVKHRLRRLAELTAFDAPGAPGDALAHAVRWWWSLRAWLARARP
jgi:PucR C-terminal helix-turn-helix domain